MKFKKEELSLLHFACGKLLSDKEERTKFSDYALDTLIDLQKRLLVEMKK